MLDTREVHEHGATHVSADGAHVLSGGADGVVALYPSAKWPHAPPLWVRQCHEAAVTHVVLQDTLHLAFSCGRDGKVILHENIDDASSTSRVICRATGEVRCLCFDAARRRVFIGGDSLRCLHLRAERFEIQAMPLAVPHPVVALALSPCGHLMAVASASRAVAVVSTSAPPAASGKRADPTEADDALAARYRSVHLVLPDVLAPSVRRVDGVSYRLSWVRTAAGLRLLIPAATESLVFELVEPSAPQQHFRLRPVGGLHGEDLLGFHASVCYALSARRLMCVMASTNGVYAARVDSKSLTAHRHAMQRFDAEVTDLQVVEATGDVVVGLSTGCVALLRKAAIKAPRAASSPAPASTKPDARPCDVDALEEQQHQRRGSGRASRSAATLDGSTVVESSTTSDDASADDAAVSSTSDASSDVNSAEEEGQRRRAHKPSHARSASPASSLSSATSEEGSGDHHGARRRASNYLDDEAEEGSDGEIESEDEAAWQDDGYGNRRRPPTDGSALAAEESSQHGDDEDDAERYSLDPAAQLDEELRAADPQAGSAGVVADYAFQCGATPAGPEGCCYLAYNTVGYITSTPEATTAHFHNVAHPAVRIAEKGVLLMGALSPTAAAFVVAPTNAAEALESVDDVPRLTVYYRAFVSAGAQAEWRVRLLPGETVRCMAAGNRYLAVATSRYLRLFSSSGLELAVLSKFSHIVTMVGATSAKLASAAPPSWDPLAVAYLNGQQLCVEVLDVTNRDVLVPPCVVPLTEQPDGSTHQLQWMGWSEDGPLHVMDTAGVLRMLTRSWGGAWVPVYDARAALDQSVNLWIWGVSDEILFAYRALKHDRAFPAAVASGLPTEHVRLAIPLCHNGATKEAVTWEHLVRRQIRTDELKRLSTAYTASIARHDALHDRKLVELFHAALREQQTTRAYDLATLLELRDNVELCAKEANREGHAQLVKKLLQLYESRVKNKTRRRCTLPLEGSVVSDRERDVLLRKLLAKERGTVATSSAAGKAAGGATPPSAAPRQSTAAADDRDGVEEVSPQRQPTPPMSSAADIAAGPRAPTPVKRRVTFDLPTGGAEPAAQVKSGPPREAPVAPRPAPAARAKPTNPFANPASSPARAAAPNNQATTTTSAAASVKLGARERDHATEPTATELQRQTRLQPAPLTQATARAAPVAAGDQQLLGASQLSAHPSTADEADIKRDAPPREPATGAQAMRPSSPHMPTAAATSAVPARPAGQWFAPRVLPAPAVSASADPFLTQDEERYTTTTESTSATVQSLLDAGHEQSELMPRSDSFGEALRKRYREDDAEEVDEDSGLPSAFIPKILS